MANRFLSDTQTRSPTTAPGGAPRTLAVLAAGLPRCATSSLQAALESDVLGFTPCMHMAEVAPRTARLQLVLAALRERDRAARHKLLHRLFDGYAATTDFPGIAFADDLMDMYPDAAVVLNRRASGRVWADSIRGSLAFFSSATYLATCLLWTTDRLHWRIHREVHALWLRRFGLPGMFSEEAYVRYNAWVRAEAAKRGRPVLEWQAGDGWAPLCEFLGRPAPEGDRAFPHLNDAATMKMVKRILIVRGLVAWAALGASVWAGWTYGPRLVEALVPAVRGWMS